MLDLQVVLDLIFAHSLWSRNGDCKGRVWVCWAAGWPSKASCTSPSVNRAARACLAYRPSALSSFSFSISDLKFLSLFFFSPLSTNINHPCYSLEQLSKSFSLPLTVCAMQSQCCSGSGFSGVCHGHPCECHPVPTDQPSPSLLLCPWCLSE